MLSTENIEPLLPTPAILAILCKVHVHAAVFTLDSGVALNLPVDQTSALSSKCSMVQHLTKDAHLVIQRLSHVT